MRPSGVLNWFQNDFANIFVVDEVTSPAALLVEKGLVTSSTTLNSFLKLLFVSVADDLNRKTKFFLGVEIGVDQFLERRVEKIGFLGLHFFFFELVTKRPVELDDFGFDNDGSLKPMFVAVVRELG